MFLFCDFLGFNFSLSQARTYGRFRFRASQEGCESLFREVWRSRTIGDGGSEESWTLVVDDFKRGEIAEESLAQGVKPNVVR
jgi:hypothetical protein